MNNTNYLLSIVYAKLIKVVNWHLSGMLSYQNHINGQTATSLALTPTETVGKSKLHELEHARSQFAHLCGFGGSYACRQSYLPGSLLFFAGIDRDRARRSYPTHARRAQFTKVVHFRGLVSRRYRRARSSQLAWALRWGIMIGLLKGSGANYRSSCARSVSARAGAL